MREPGTPTHLGHAFEDTTRIKVERDDFFRVKQEKGIAVKEEDRGGRGYGRERSQDRFGGGKRRES